MFPVLSFSDLVIDRETFYHNLVLLEITTVKRPANVYTRDYPKKTFYLNRLVTLKNSQKY